MITSHCFLIKILRRDVNRRCNANKCPMGYSYTLPQYRKAANAYQDGSAGIPCVCPIQVDCAQARAASRNLSTVMFSPPVPLRGIGTTGPMLLMFDRRLSVSNGRGHEGEERGAVGHVIQ